MIRAMVWKEWGENRWKYGAMWAIFNAPILLISFALAVSRAARTPFADLSDGTVMKYLPLSLGESFLIASVMLVVTALVGVASFRTELDSGSLYFLFDLPVPRKRYIGLKVGNGVVHVALAVTFAILFAPLVDYGLILLTGKVTVAGS